MINKLIVRLLGPLTQAQKVLYGSFLIACAVFGMVTGLWMAELYRYGFPVLLLGISLATMASLVTFAAIRLAMIEEEGSVSS
jgi:hypothetical protein